MNARLTRLAGVSTGLLLLPVTLFAAQPLTLNGFDLRGATVPVSAIERGGPPRDGIPAIDQPKFIQARDARLRDADRVLGLVHRGVVRAYPVPILNWHEIVNDRIAGDPVIVSYCPLCGTGMAFDGRLGAADTRFGVSGLLYNSDVLLYDRATESLWTQIGMAAVTGPRKGTRLKPLPLTHTTWADWRKRHPATEVLSTETGVARDYGRDPYAGYASVPQLMFNVQHRDERVPPKAWVLGVTINGQSKAYPFDVLAKRADAQGRLRDTIAGQSIEVRYSREHDSAEAFNAQGQVLPAVSAYWFAWVAFHPETGLLTPQ